jgi:branched-chain amino acid transport system substrate-binding protein
VANEFCPDDTTDFSPYILRVKEAAPDYVYVVWSGANSPWPQLMEFDLAQYGINLITGAPEIASLKAMNYAAGMVGFCVYHWTLPRNEINDWLVMRMDEEYGKVPDLFTPGGMAAAMAIVTALEKTDGDASAAALIPAMEGMRFNSPTGERYFRAEDHQAIQPLYAMELEAIEGLDYPQPKLIKELDAESIKPAIKAPNR